jgi:hypothetical protein
MTRRRAGEGMNLHGLVAARAGGLEARLSARLRAGWRADGV